ncbi:hypothetical protein K1T71_004662 [Dendrolimus kikuchii]|uniref:Uncharacterized protein n=1 Tax=Dendrolimus kikuchii TaxID=765133 RepID=A0ACC1D838_9NEOP|nr:hypothetical protein K1T71_004662 [Dendrolimus kikuchii]
MSGAASEAATQTSRRFKDIETVSSVVPKQWKSASVSVSSRLPVEPIKVPIDVATDKSIFENDRIVNCGCAEFGTDFGINTEIVSPLNLECLTQTSASYLRKVNPTNEFTPANCTLACQRHLSEINQRLLSLTRLISQRKSNSQIYSNFHPITENALSSNLNAAKWLKRCASIEKGYPVALPTPPTLTDVTKSSVSASFYAKLPRELKKQLELLSSEYHSNKLHDVNYVLEAAPAVTLSRDSLADVLPSQKLPENPIDKAICDEGAKKDVTETILQVSPENCDAATVTDCALNYTTKSVYAVTSRIILPSPKSCYQCNEYGKPCIECLYVYDKPRCVIHKQQTDATVQKEPSSYDIQSKIRSHGRFDSNGKLVAPGTRHHFNQRTEYFDVLPPKVYKALYEATRLVFKDGSEDQPYKNMITNSCAVGTDFIQTSKICSASVVSSELKSEQTKQDQCTSPGN